MLIVWSRVPARLPDDILSWPDAICLDPVERARAARFVLAADRARFVLGRVVIKRVLGAILDQPAPSVTLTVTDTGKPVLAPGPAGLDFSLAHAGDLLVLAVGWRQLGVDLEPDGRQVAPAVLAPFLTPDEQAWLTGLSPADQPRAALDLWTAKEALGKAMGLGLAAPLADPQESWRIYRLSAPDGASAHLAIADGDAIDLQTAWFDVPDGQLRRGDAPPIKSGTRGVPVPLRQEARPPGPATLRTDSEPPG